MGVSRRATTDLVLARGTGEPSRGLRISQRLPAQRGDHCEQLGRAQHEPLEVTPWVVLFTELVHAAFDMAA
jgi:hypothetical protein